MPCSIGLQHHCRMLLVICCFFQQLLNISSNGVVYLDGLSGAWYCISRPAKGCSSYTHLLLRQNNRTTNSEHLFYIILLIVKKLSIKLPLSIKNIRNCKYCVNYNGQGRCYVLVRLASKHPLILTVLCTQNSHFT